MNSNPLKADLDHILDHTKGIWEELKERRIFITGGTGFFGCWLLESFIWANEKLRLEAEAVVLTRDYKAFLKNAPHLATNSAVKFFKGDVRDFAYPKGKFHFIIHAASEPNSEFNRKNPFLMFDTIVEGTRRVLDFANFCGVKKILLTSSGAVYGKQPYDITHIPEDYKGKADPLDPISVYGIGKLTEEHLCVLYSKQYGIEAKIARCFSFVGPYLALDIHYAIGNFIRDGLKGGPILVRGDGTPYRSYLYAADLAIWLWTILIKGQSCKPYNVGSEEGLTIAALANCVAKAFYPRPAVKISKIQKGKVRKERYVPFVKLAKRELGLKQWIGLEDSIKKTINWHTYY